MTSAIAAMNNPHAPNAASEAAVTKKTRKMVERRYCIIGYAAGVSGFLAIRAASPMRGKRA